MDNPILLTVIGVVLAGLGFTCFIKSLAYNKWPLDQQTEERYNKAVKWEYGGCFLLIPSVCLLIIACVTAILTP